MLLSLHLARRILKGAPTDGPRRHASPPAIRLATAGIAVGLAVMIVSVAIVVGFKREVSARVTSLDAHLQVVALSANRTADAPPVAVGDSLVAAIRTVRGVDRVEPFATTLCELRADSDFVAVVMMGKAIGEPGIVPSARLARRLRLGVGDEATAYFVRTDGTDPLALGAGSTSVRSRRLAVSATYETHFADYDDRVVTTDIGLLRDVAAWDDDMATGLQVYVDDIDRLDEVEARLLDAVGGQTDRRGTVLTVVSARDLHPQIFAWLDLLDTNVWVILALVAVVATFTMTSGLLIIILEHTHTIGVLKALGCDDRRLRHAMMAVAAMLTLRGLAWGNAVGLGLCAVQRLWHPLHLDPQNYYLEHVPIGIEAWHVVALNVATVVLTLVVVSAPSALVSRISPAKVMQAE